MVSLSPPLLAKDYKKCIFGTTENMKLSDGQIIDCEDFNPQPGEEHVAVEPLLVKEINCIGSDLI